MDALTAINRRRIGIDPADAEADIRFSEKHGATTRLCVYGRMLPDGPDAHVLGHLGGVWSSAIFRGFLKTTETSGPRYVWAPDGDALDGQVLTASLLGDAWRTLDLRAGNDGVRLLCEVETRSGPMIANIYANRAASRARILTLDNMNVHQDR